MLQLCTLRKIKSNYLKPLMVYSSNNQQQQKVGGKKESSLLGRAGQQLSRSLTIYNLVKKQNLSTGGDITSLSTCHSNRGVISLVRVEIFLL